MSMVRSTYRTEGGSVRGAAPARAVVRPARWRRNLVGWAYVAPALAVFAIAIIGPMVYGVWVSFFEWDGITAAKPVGLDNYASVFTDPGIRAALGHSLFLLVFYSVFPISIGLVFAAVIARQRLWMAPMWRTLLFLPQVLSIVVVGVAWQWILAADGPLNVALRGVGLGGVTRSWLGDFTWALPSEGAIGTWLMSGLCMVLLLAGAQTLDPQLYDAAAVDGAGPIRQFFHVTVPGLRNVIVVCLVLSAAVSLNNFGLIWVTTQGGPGDSTQVISTAIYTRAFVRSQLGMASALAIVVFFVMVGLAAVLARRSEDA
ncbi:sugar ABC transporter permease [Nocardioides sp. LMS-CY]|uniref:Raffinose/stachyose/melibiose transport system permease protein n=1 Tax=Nocardioides soli TaxID=1036020 RepID=A0A7W4Z0G7_9ACTN|nr:MULTISPECIES: sugar ABC transporter permease [Nocardioides]MBB3041897.1 raffinose/stachyose/melibiose transport system permease protein [Nocardioides soli]QWF21404.1 sugar ABC transporter permease [Nocardioides sp. LMS-CY]